MNEYTIGFLDHRGLEFAGAVVLCRDDDRAEDEANELVAAAQHRWCARIALRNKASDRCWTIEGPLHAGKACPNCGSAECEGWKLQQARNGPTLRAFLTLGDEETPIAAVQPNELKLRTPVALMLTLDRDDAIDLARDLLNAAQEAIDDGESQAAVWVDGFLQVSNLLEDDELRHEDEAEASTAKQ